jgi:hypothetical protein
MKDYKKSTMIVSYVIGYLVTYLPFFTDMTGQIDHIACGMGLGIVALIILDHVEELEANK